MTSAWNTPIAELRAQVEEAIVVSETGDELLVGALDWRGHLDAAIATPPEDYRGDSGR